MYPFVNYPWVCVNYVPVLIVRVHEPLEMGRESSLGMKELFNLPPQRWGYLSGSGFCIKIRYVPEQAIGGSP